MALSGRQISRSGSGCRLAKVRTRMRQTNFTTQLAAWDIETQINLMTVPSMPPPPQKVALVTGAARGIGLAVAKRFLDDGWRVALLDIEGALLDGAVAGLANPDGAMALHCDVSDAEAVTEAIAKVGRHFGRLDALINNAGIAVF